MWHFRKKRKGEKIRDPVQGEFFATDAIEDPAQALVRESIQNSLDASIGQQVAVRIYVSTRDGAVPWESVAPWFAGAWKHYSAPRNGLRDAPEEGEACEFIVIEDFGTSGLTGDPSQADPIPDTKNAFLSFFRAEGRSDKEELSRGRWGVGKFVFPRSSRISSHFGLTVRVNDSKVLLLGASTLKAHRLGTETYCPDGLYGIEADDDFVLPLENPDALAAFRSTFAVSRADEPGLSVVVPYVYSDITFERLIAACATDYFLPILQGELIVKLESPAQGVTLEACNLEATLTAFAGDLGKEVVRYVDVARWGAALSERNTLRVAGADGSMPKWSNNSVPPELLARMRDEIRERRRVAVRVPLVVRPRAPDGSWSEATTHFDILLDPDRGASGRPLFAREGIVVSDVKAPRAREIRSLVLIEDKPLASFLGDSENPAHTQWQKDGSNFKGKYKNGPGTLAFVTTSASELMKIINSAEKEADPSLTVDFFSLPADAIDDTEKGTDTKERRPDHSQRKKVKIESNPPAVEIRRHAGGFVVAPGPGVPTEPFIVSIEVAYDVRSGNPLKRYHIADFDIASPEFQVKTSGVDVSIRKRNTLVADAENEHFSIEVAGFDVARDLYIRANVTPKAAEEQGDASTAV